MKLYKVTGEKRLYQDDDVEEYIEVDDDDLNDTEAEQTAIDEVESDNSDADEWIQDLEAEEITEDDFFKATGEHSEAWQEEHPDFNADGTPVEDEAAV